MNAALRNAFRLRRMPHWCVTLVAFRLLPSIAILSIEEVHPFVIAAETSLIAKLFPGFLFSCDYVKYDALFGVLVKA